MNFVFKMMNFVLKNDDFNVNVQMDAQDLFEKLDNDATGTIPTAYVEQIDVLLGIMMNIDHAKKQLDASDTGIIDEERFILWYCGDGAILHEKSGILEPN